MGGLRETRAEKMAKGALKAAALACAFSSCSAFAPAVVGGKIASQHNKLSLSNRARAPTRAGVAATSMDLGLLAGVPLMYCLMSANEYVTHRYYQHNEVGKLEIYQTLRKMGKIPKLDGGGHIEHHAETYDDMSLKTDNPVWMASAPAQRMVGNKYRGTAFTWGVTRDMCLQCVPTVFPALLLACWSARLSGLRIPSPQPRRPPRCERQGQLQCVLPGHGSPRWHIHACGGVEAPGARARNQGSGGRVGRQRHVSVGADTLRDVHSRTRQIPCHLWQGTSPRMSVVSVVCPLCCK